MQQIPEWLGISIIIAPLGIFIILMVIVHFILTLQGVKLSNLLAETEVVLKHEEEEALNKEAAKKNEGKKEDEVPKKAPIKRSASRLVLFLSGITALTLATCITSFYFFIHIYCVDCAMELNLADFTNILLALGIGVVPYAVNQVKRVRL